MPFFSAKLLPPAITFFRTTEAIIIQRLVPIHAPQPPAEIPAQTVSLPPIWSHNETGEAYGKADSAPPFRPPFPLTQIEIAR
jgi:hypothetical protein